MEPMSPEKLRRLAERGWIKTKETHPEEYEEFLGKRSGYLQSLERLAQEYMEQAPSETSDEGENLFEEPAPDTNV